MVPLTLADVCTAWHFAPVVSASIAGRPVTLLLHVTRNPLRTRVRHILRSRVVSVLTRPPAPVTLYAAVVIGTRCATWSPAGPGRARCPTRGMLRCLRRRPTVKAQPSRDEQDEDRADPPRP
jgi:hypothetical protein